MARLIRTSPLLLSCALIILATITISMIVSYLLIQQNQTCTRESNNFHGLHWSGNHSLVTALPRIAPTGKIIFIKTHKTCSSSISGILWRSLCAKSSMQRNCFLPAKSNPGRTWNFESRQDRAYATASPGVLGKGRPFDVWLHHVKINEFLFKEVMNHTVDDKSHSSIKFISIVRKPAQRFRSAWSWYQHGNKLLSRLSAMSLEKFVMWLSPHAHVCNTLQKTARSRGSFFSVTTSDVLNWGRRLFVQGFIKTQFKYRTGLDATAEELTGFSVTNPSFADAFSKLLFDVYTGKVLLLVCDRFDESLLVLNEIILKLESVSIEENTTKLSSHPLFHLIRESELTTHELPFPQLSFLTQKQQNSLEKLSAWAEEELDSLQPYDSLLFKVANSMLDHYIDLIYGDANGGENGINDNVSDRGRGASTNSSANIHSDTGHKADLQFALSQLKKQFKWISASCTQETEYRRTGDLCESLTGDNKELVLSAWNNLDTWLQSPNQPKST